MNRPVDDTDAYSGECKGGDGVRKLVMETDDESEAGQYVNLLDLGRTASSVEQSRFG
jgi:hypothetical protein